MIGAAAGGPEIGLNQLYKQVYDWTPYGPNTNPNFWIKYANDPAGFFSAILSPQVL